MIHSSHSIELSAAEAAAADTLCGLLSAYPRDAMRQALDLAAFHFKLALKRHRKPRKPTLAAVAKQASKAGIAVARYKVKPDGTVVIVTGKPEAAAPENPWPLDEFRTKETKQ